MQLVPGLAPSVPSVSAEARCKVFMEMDSLFIQSPQGLGEAKACFSSASCGKAFTGGQISGGSPRVVASYGPYYGQSMHG
jgi:hypothetical protein